MRTSLRHPLGTALVRLGVGVPLVLAPLAAALGEDADRSAPPAAVAEAPAAIQAIEVYPTRLTLDGPRDARRVLVTGITADGARVDLSASATYTPRGPGIVFDALGFAHGQTDGAHTVVVAAAGHEVELPVAVANVEAEVPVSFVRDVMPLLSRVGCNAGTCHGADKGKNGFKFSLRGYDPDFDYHQLVDDLAGRRFNRSDPQQSLMLLKPTMGVPHEGGHILDEGTPYYEILHDWIAQGAQSDVGQTSRVASLEVYPPSIDLARATDSQQLLVLAHYPDGATRDVTLDAIYSSSVPDVATVSETGQITAERRGESAILVRYEGAFGVGHVTVMGDRTGFVWQPRPENNYIDTLVNRKLERAQILPSPPCTDEEFLRRVYLDLTGVPPTPVQVRAFLADPADSASKRDRVIDELIGSPEYVAHWTYKWADLFQANRKLLGDKSTWSFVRWIESAIAQNLPYDQMVRTLVTAQGSSIENPAVNYFRASKEPDTALENATQLLLGIRFSCNKCHDHPFESWTQNQYYGMAAYWSQVGIKPGAREGEQIVFDQTSGDVTHPKDGRVVAPNFPYEHEGQARVQTVSSRREQLAEWLTAPENPYFARSLVNRVWSYFLGIGIIDPVDDIRLSNPPTNPELLDALEEDFIASGFDLQHLMRTIVTSQTYQASIVTNEFNEDDTINFSHATPRRLTAEQLLDAIHQAAGSLPKFEGVPEGFRANQLPDTQVASGGFLDLFGRPARESPCECERSSEMSLAQALNLVNGPTIAEALIDPEGRIARLVASGADARTLIEDVYLATLCRFPTAAELAQGEEYLHEAEGLAEGAQDLMWALINSPAFLFNR